MGDIIVTKEWVTCNLCKQNDFKEVFNDPKTGFGHGYCNHCGLIYINPRMDPPSRKDFYASFSQKYPESFIKDTSNELRQVAKKRAAFFLSFLKDNNLQPKSFLEVGCSYGFLLKELEDAGTIMQLAGLEPSTTERDFAYRITDIRNINIFTGFVEDLKEQLRKFDVIALFHVLEHIGDPLSVLSILYDCLETDGLLWVEVPDVEELKGDLMEFQYFISCQHLYEFSLFTLKQMLEYIGFEEIILTKAPVGHFHQSNQRAIFKKSKSPLQKSIERDTKAPSYLLNYHNRIKTVKKRIESWLEIYSKSAKKVYIYGGGFHTIGLLGAIIYSDSHIEAIIDDDEAKHGTYLKDIPIVAPSIIDKVEPGVIIISTLAGEKTIFEKLKYLMTKGWEIKKIYGDI